MTVDSRTLSRSAPAPRELLSCRAGFNLLGTSESGDRLLLCHCNSANAQMGSFLLAQYCRFIRLHPYLRQVALCVRHLSVEAPDFLLSLGSPRVETRDFLLSLGSPCVVARDFLLGLGNPSMETRDFLVSLGNPSMETRDFLVSLGSPSTETSDFLLSVGSRHRVMPDVVQEHPFPSIH